MINWHRFLIAASFAAVLPLTVFAEAPVVDDSENFALLDDQQAAHGRPVGRSYASNTYRDDDEQPLASDRSDVGSHTASNVELLNKLQGLQQDIQELRGQLEVQAHDLKLLQQQQLTFYKDLDARLRSGAPNIKQKEPAAELSMETSPPASKTIPKAAVQPTEIPQNTQPHTNPADEQISYLAAYELIKNKRFDEALPAMQAFVTQHPQGGYTANAQYWLGELYMVKKNYPEAITHFEAVLQQFPSSNKSAASLLKIGYALAASGNKEEAILRLQQVIKNYPDTNTAQLAKAKLESLNSR